MLETLFIQPVLNILGLLYAIIPGQNFGVVIIVFTILTRWVMFPLLRKQLKHTRAMREMAPEIKKIKKKAKGNRQQESMMMMELYKEKELKPMAFFGMMVLQIVIFLTLFAALNRVVNDPRNIYELAYGPISDLSAIQELKQSPGVFDNTLFGTVDLTRAASSQTTGFYLPAFLLVLGSAVTQFFQIRQTMPRDKDARKLRDILNDAKTGKEPDNSEVNAAMGRNMGYIMPVIIFVVTIGFPAAIALYWFTSGLIAYLQQRYLLKQDVTLMQSTAKVVNKTRLDNTAKARASKAKTAQTIPSTHAKKSKTTNKKKGSTKKSTSGKAGNKRSS